MKNACYHAQIAIHANFVVCEEIHKMFNYFTKDNPCSGRSEDCNGGALHGWAPFILLDECMWDCHTF